MPVDPVGHRVDPTDYRRVVGRFATGVTVVTATSGGEQHGMTASSFTSVSLEPVLALVSVEKIARFHRVVLDSGAFAVNVLTADQEQVSRWFATRGRPATDQFRDVPHHAGPATGAAVLDECLAWLECTTYAVYDGGDHSLVLGEVVAMSVPRPAARPLLYFDGSYRSLAVD